MKDELTELVFILDKSGSMAGLEEDTIGGYNALLARQKKEPGEAIVTTVLFDDDDELLHDRINIRGVSPLTDRDYQVGGCTALLDAVGRTIHKLVRVQQATKASERAGKLMFVITTDGMENASREYTAEKVRKMIRQQTQQGWEFVFLGANMDAVAAAADIGIREDRAARYQADQKGTRLNYAVMNDIVSEYRTNRTISSDWKSVWKTAETPVKALIPFDRPATGQALLQGLSIAVEDFFHGDPPLTYSS